LYHFHVSNPLDVKKLFPLYDAISGDGEDEEDAAQRAADDALILAKFGAKFGARASSADAGDDGEEGPGVGIKSHESVG
jgi:hypothetical protein